MAEQEELKAEFNAFQALRNAANPNVEAVSRAYGFFPYPDGITSTDRETMRLIQTVVEKQCGGVFPNGKHTRIRAFHAALRMVFASQMKLEKKELYKILTWNNYHEEIRQRIMKDALVQKQTIRGWMTEEDLMFVAERNAVSIVERDRCRAILQEMESGNRQWEQSVDEKLPTLIGRVVNVAEIAKVKGIEAFSDEEKMSVTGCIKALTRSSLLSVQLQMEWTQWKNAEGLIAYVDRVAAIILRS